MKRFQLKPDDHGTNHIRGPIFGEFTPELPEITITFIQY
jgi:hypothetical protein